MLGKPEWFMRRKYGGWGVFPKTWQGWVYIAVMVIPLVVINLLPFLDGRYKLTALIAWGVVLGVDMVDIMYRMPKDEREKIHEAIAERNALWVMVALLGFGIAYQVASGMVRGVVTIDPVILVALFGGLAMKAATNIYLDRHD